MRVCFVCMSGMDCLKIFELRAKSHSGPDIDIPVLDCSSFKVEFCTKNSIICEIKNSGRTFENEALKENEVIPSYVDLDPVGSAFIWVHGSGFESKGIKLLEKQSLTNKVLGFS